MSIKLKNRLLQNQFPCSHTELPKLEILNVTSNANLKGSFPEFCNNPLEHVNLNLDTFLWDCTEIYKQPKTYIGYYWSLHKALSDTIYASINKYIHHHAMKVILSHIQNQQRIA